MLIGVCGFKGSGKDTVGQRLVSTHSFQHDSFARPVKDALASIMNWDREMLEGSTPESRLWREREDPFWSQVLGRPITPRMALQQFGTDVMRKHFHQEVWVQSMKARLLEYERQGHDVVVTDCRFPNEIALLREMGGTIIRVARGEDPHWMEDARKANSGSWLARWRMKRRAIHPSEWAWIGQDFDAQLVNDGDVETLWGKVAGLLQSISRSP